jgi:TRAP transporter 4TM/12TM fusion protein
MRLREKVARVIALIVNIEAAALVLYQLSFVWWQTSGPSEHYAIFFGAVFSIVVLKTIEGILTKGPEGSQALFTFKLIILSYALFAGLIATVYIRANLIRLETEIGLLNNLDIAVGLNALAALCIAGYFTWGTAMVVFALAAFLYFLFGDVLPGFWGHQDYGIGWVLSYTTLHPVLGTYWLIPLTADVVFYVLLFSGVMAKTGTVSALLEIGKGVGRRVTGGVAYPALFGSALLGTMVGQAVANVVITGRVTIPAMKQQGVHPPMAAAVEAAASAGSLIMPPIMGMGAFVMAFYLNVPYIEVALAAAIPAILYYSAVGVGIYFNARVSAMPRSHEQVDWHLVGRVIPTFLVGVGVLSALLMQDYTMKIAAFWALVIAMATALLIQGRYRPRLRAILDGLLDGAKTAAELGLLLALVGPVAQTIQSTGFGVNLANALIISPAGQVAMLALPLTMILTLLTGCAIIEAATYIILALVLAPFLEEAGFNRMAAHMFIYYYAVFATLTPPIAITAAAASRIAECNFWDTCFRALKLAFIGIVVPYVFVFNPVLLEFPRITLPVLATFGLAVASLVLLSASFWGWLVNPLRVYDRIVLAASGVLLLAAAALKRADLMGVGLALGGLVVAWQWFKRDRRVPVHWRMYWPASRYRPEQHYMRGPGPKSEPKRRED